MIVIIYTNVQGKVLKGTIGSFYEEPSNEEMKAHVLRWGSDNASVVKQMHVYYFSK